MKIKINQGPQRKIIHVDMDCFFAQVELRDRPELQGQPVAVGGEPGKRGVISAADYVARRFGVRSALSSVQAKRLCPNLVILPHSFSKYKEESQKIRDVFRRYTDLIEPLSLDEAFMDVTDCQKIDGSATLLAQEIRREIFKATSLTASAGIAPNKFLAKIASDWRKPNGQFTISPKQIPEFMIDLPIEKIFGVGKVTAAKMKKKGFHTCGDLQQLDQFTISKLFGSWGARLYRLCRGSDDRPVNTERKRKSFSVEHTFLNDLNTPAELQEEVGGLYEEFSKRWERSGISVENIKGLGVKLKFSDFRQTTHESKSKGFPVKSDFENLVFDSWEKNSKEPLRLLGVGVKLHTEDELEPIKQQLPLFDGKA